MTFDYSRMVATSNRLIERFGQLGSIQRPGTPTGPSYNPTPGTPTSHAARFVITAYSSREVDGTRILTSDKKALISPGSLSIDPTMTDLLIEADGASWKIVDVETLRPAGTTLLYTAQVRK
jgi:hypothetical protein